LPSAQGIRAAVRIQALARGSSGHHPSYVEPERAAYRPASDDADYLLFLYLYYQV
jgi:hypothetical protein